MKLIYLTPNSEWEFNDFEALPKEEQLKVAESDPDMVVYTIEEFVRDFNADFISDIGFIVIIND